MTRQFKTGTARITVDYGYDIHSLTCSVRTLKCIQKGTQILLRGQGFPVEDVIEDDVWCFNTREPGSIWVYTLQGFEVFRGNLQDGEVFIVVLG